MAAAAATAAAMAVVVLVKPEVSLVVVVVNVSPFVDSQLCDLEAAHRRRGAHNSRATAPRSIPLSVPPLWMPGTERKEGRN